MDMIAISGIVHYRDRLLVCKRPLPSAFPCMWEFPTELLEGEETLEDALERLFFERFSVLPRTIEVKAGLNLERFDGMRLYLAHVVLEKRKWDVYGYSDFKWLKLKDLKKYRLAPACEECVKKMRQSGYFCG